LNKASWVNPSSSGLSGNLSSFGSDTRGFRRSNVSPNIGYSGASDSRAGSSSFSRGHRSSYVQRIHSVNSLSRNEHRLFGVSVKRNFAEAGFVSEVYQR
jgi:hypothetical protein